jgi:hypothetical protein
MLKTRASVFGVQGKENEKMTNKHAASSGLFLLCALLAPVHLNAQLFSIAIESPGFTPYFETFNNAENSIDSMDTTNLRSHFQGINENTAAVNGSLNYRGLPMNFELVPNSSEVRFTVPSLGIDQTFNAATRDASLDQLVDFLQKDGGQITNDISKELARITPTDPIAGNPGSLMSTQVSSVFSSDFFGSGTGTGTGSGSGSGSGSGNGSADADNKWHLGVEFTNSKANDNAAETVTLPFSYTVNFDANPEHSLRIDFPVSSTTINGEAKSYTLATGLALSFPVSASVRLTPGFNFGAVGSEDLASAAAARSIFLTTIYDFIWAGENWRFGNTISASKTESLELEDVVLDPEISNRIMVNGIVWRGLPVSWGHVELFLTDTRFFGDELYSEQYNDIGFNITKAGAYVLQLGFTYQWTDRSDLEGWTINTSSSF